MSQTTRKQEIKNLKNMDASGKLDISVVVCAQNAEVHLEACLERLGRAGEIVVWDNESTDRTVEIAKRFTPHVHIKKMDIEGAYRNHTFTQTQYRWVMYVDPDERIPDALWDEIAEVIQSKEPYVGYSIPRKNMYAGDYWIQYGGLYPSPQLRVFLKDKFRFEEVEIHGRNFLDGPWRYLKQPLIHHIYADFGQAIKKINRQTSLEVIKWERDNRPFKIFLMIRKTIDRFIKSYLVKQGFRDGFIGWMISFFSGFYQLISFFKRWEGTHAEEVKRGYQRYQASITYLRPSFFSTIAAINEETTQKAKGAERDQRFVWPVLSILRAKGRFLLSWVGRGFFRYGMYGGILATFEALYQLLYEVKVWEVVKRDLY
jgi:(heptosyl)LPS beta-1,4-glucosyltransferase